MSALIAITQMHRAEDGRSGCSLCQRQVGQGREAGLGMSYQKCSSGLLPDDHYYEYDHYDCWMVG